MIEEWKEALSLERDGGYEVARLSYEAFKSPDFDYETLRHELAAAGYDLPEKGTLSKRKTAYEFWAVRQGKDRATFQRVGYSKLYTLAKFLETSADDPDVWLEKAVGTSREALKAEIEGQPLQERMRVLRMPESVYEDFARGVHKLYEVNGASFPGETLLGGVEVCAALLNEASFELLQTIWRVQHGEEA